MNDDEKDELTKYEAMLREQFNRDLELFLVGVQEQVIILP